MVSTARADLMRGMQEHLIPEHMRPGLLHWIEEGKRPGHFLTAILENDLRRSFERADDINITRIHSYLRFLYNCAPTGCWGSPLKVKVWEREHGIRTEPRIHDLFDEEPGE